MNKIAAETFTFMGTPAKFLSLANARSFANRAKAMTVIMGEHPYFWVVTLAQADKLIALGYELA